MHHLMRGGRRAGVWLHGEAVAAGMVMAADMSLRLGWIERDVLDRTVRLLQRAQLPVTARAVRRQRPAVSTKHAPARAG